MTRWMWPSPVPGFRWAREHCAVLYPNYEKWDMDTVSMRCPACVREHREGRRHVHQVHQIMIQFRPDGRVTADPGGRFSEIDPTDLDQITCGYHKLGRPISEWGPDEYLEWAYRTGNVVRGDD